MRASRLTLLVVIAVSVALASCSRSVEVVVLQAVPSPDGQHVAFVEEHVYGPHFGGETPAVEVHIRKKEDPSTKDGRVFEVASEGATISVRWLGPSRLLIVHPTSALVVPVPSQYDGVAIERSVQ